jgi:hypothetical protein
VTDPLASLVGRYFHTTRTCPGGHTIPVWQGHVISAPAAGVLLIETFEWVMGEPHGQEFITVDDFVSKQPVLYADGDEMRFSYEHGRMNVRCTGDACVLDETSADR